MSPAATAALAVSAALALAACGGGGPNPYDGLYVYDLDRVESPRLRENSAYGLQIGAEPLALSVSGPDATLLGYQRDAPVRPNGYNVCLTDGGMVLRNAEGRGYCGVAPGDAFEIAFRPTASGDLVCPTCESRGLPGTWRRLPR